MRVSSPSQLSSEYLPSKAFCAREESWWAPLDLETAAFGFSDLLPNSPVRSLSWVPSRHNFQFGNSSFSLKYFSMRGSTDWCFWQSSILSENFQAALVFTTEFLKTGSSQVVTECSSFSGWLSDVLVISFAEVLKPRAETEISRSCALIMWRAV